MMPGDGHVQFYLHTMHYYFYIRLFPLLQINHITSPFLWIFFFASGLFSLSPVRVRVDRLHRVSRSDSGAETHGFRDRQVHSLTKKKRI